MNKQLTYIWGVIYDQESQENIKRLKGYVSDVKAKAKRKSVERLYRILDNTVHCDGSILCVSDRHVTSCYAHAPSHRVWKNQMSKILDNAR